MPIATAILVVDARELRRQRLAAQLQSLASTRATGSALHALQLMDEQRADIVITAVQFPAGDIHGLALGHLIKNRWPDVEVVTLVEDGEDIGIDWEMPGGTIAVTPGRANVAYLPLRAAPVDDPMILKARELLKKAS